MRLPFLLKFSFIFFTLFISKNGVATPSLCEGLFDGKAITETKNLIQNGYSENEPVPNEKLIRNEQEAINLIYRKEKVKPGQIKTTLNAIRKTYSKKFGHQKFGTSILDWIAYFIYNLKPKPSFIDVSMLNQFELVKQHMENAQLKIQALEENILPFKNDVDTIHCDREFGICAGYSQLTRLFNILVLDNKTPNTNLNLSKRLILEAENIKLALMKYEAYQLQYFSSKTEFITSLESSVLKKPHKILVEAALILWFRNFASLSGLIQLFHYNLYGPLTKNMSLGQYDEIFASVEATQNIYPPQLYVTFWDTAKHQLHKDIHVVLGVNVIRGIAEYNDIDVLTIRDDKFYGNRSIQTFENRIYFAPPKNAKKNRRNVFYLSPHIFLDEKLLAQILGAISKNAELSSEENLEKLHNILLSYLRDPLKKSQNIKDMRSFLLIKNQKLHSKDFDKNYLKEFIDEVDRIGIVPGQAQVMSTAITSLISYFSK